MLLLTPVCVGSSTILVLAVLTPFAVCRKPLQVCLFPRQEVDYNVLPDSQNFDYECLQNSPLMTSFTPKEKKYFCGPILFDPFYARVPTVSVPTIPSCPELHIREIRQVPSIHRMIAQVEDKSIRHVPVVHKVKRNVVEYRTRHVPVVKHRLRTVEEKYTEHVPITETITRPIVDTVVKQVPIVALQGRRGGFQQRMTPTPTEQRVVNELLRLKQNPLYRLQTCGLPYFFPQQFKQPCVKC